MFVDLVNRQVAAKPGCTPVIISQNFCWSDYHTLQKEFEAAKLERPEGPKLEWPEAWRFVVSFQLAKCIFDPYLKPNDPLGNGLVRTASRLHCLPDSRLQAPVPDHLCTDMCWRCRAGGLGRGVRPRQARTSAKGTGRLRDPC